MSPADSLHVHFVDGGAGGYTSASRSMKSAAGAASTSGARPRAGPPSRWV